MGCGASTPTSPLQASCAEKIDLQSAPAPSGPPLREDREEIDYQETADRERRNSLDDAVAVKQPPDSAKGQNPGFFDLNPGEEAKSSGQEDSIKAGVTKHSMREHELENSTSDAASHGSHINTFDSLSQFEKAGMTNHLATTFRRPKPSQYQDVGAFSISSQLDNPHKGPANRLASSGNDSPGSSSNWPRQQTPGWGANSRGRATTPPPGMPETSPRRRRNDSSPAKGGGLAPGRHTQRSPARQGSRQAGQRKDGRSPMRGAQMNARDEGGSSAEAKPRGPTTERRKKSWSLLSGDEMLHSNGRTRTPEQRRRKRRVPQKPEQPGSRSAASKPPQSDSEDDLSGPEGSWRRPAPQRHPPGHPLGAAKGESDKDASSTEGKPRTRRSRQNLKAGCKPEQEKREPEAAVEQKGCPRPSSRQARRSPGHAHSPQAPEKLKHRHSPTRGARQQAAHPEKASKQRLQYEGQPFGGCNPFAELVDTQASSLDQLLTTASMNKPTLTTVIGNPLASNGSLTEEEAQQIEDMMQSGLAFSSTGSYGTSAGNNNIGGWQELPQHTSAQQWRPMGCMSDAPPAALLNSDAPSDAATLGSLLNTVADVPMESQHSASLRNWNVTGQQGAAASSTNVTSLVSSSRGSLGVNSDSEGEVPLPNMVTSTRLNIGEIKMNLDRYDNLGPICDITTHSITQGAMRLLRRRSNGKLYAGKFIPRPQGGVLHKWHEREIINHRAAHGHQHVIGFRDLFLSDSHVVIVMDYASCGSLASLLQERGTLPELEAKRLFRQLVLGVAHCHSKGVFHRNLQLECILMDGNEGSPTLKIGGFSRSKSGEADSLPKSTVSRPAYTAPELLQGTFAKGDLSGHNGSPLDVWAIGLLLYHMLFGYNPFQGAGKKRDGFTTQMMRRICSADFGFPESPSISPECKDLLKQILVAEPKQRIGVPGILRHAWLTQPLATEVLQQRPEATASAERVVQRVAANEQVKEADVLEAVARSRQRRGLAGS